MQWSDFAPALEKELTDLFKFPESCADFPVSVEMDQKQWQGTELKRAWRFSDLRVDGSDTFMMQDTGKYHIYIDKLGLNSEPRNIRYNITIGNDRTLLMQMHTLDKRMCIAL